MALGLYAEDDADTLSVDLAVASRLLRRAIEVLPEEAWSTTIDYSALVPEPVPLSWVAAQALHEAFHHAGDAEEGIALLG